MKRWRITYFVRPRLSQLTPKAKDITVLAIGVYDAELKATAELSRLGYEIAYGFGAVQV